MKKQIAVIFDMDGVIVDNYSYHQKAWSIFCKKYKINLDATFRSKVFGGTNKDHLEAFFNRELTSTEISIYEYEKESLYRDLYKSDISPVAGIIEFLENLYHNRVPMVVATSSPPVNADFVLERTNTRKYFSSVFTASDVTKGKPDPEIYLKAIESLNRNPQDCIVFEDSISGINAAKNAGAKVIALATTHPKEDLPEVDLVIPDFKGFTFEEIIKLY